MRISNDPGDGGGGPWAELLRLQSEFQARLADETLRYLRRLQGALGPAAPGTVVLPDGSVELRAEAHPGSAVALSLEIENRQRVHCVASPMLSPLVGAGGSTWFPEADLVPASTLVAPGEVATLSIAIQVPAPLPADTYRGTLLLHGFRDGGIPVTLVVADAAPAAPPAPANRRPRRPRPAAAASRPRRKAG